MGTVHIHTMRKTSPPCLSLLRRTCCLSGRSLALASWLLAVALLPILPVSLRADDKSPQADDKSTATLQVNSALVTLIEQVEVPAREAGVLADIKVKEGQLVSRDGVLARIDDTEADLAARRAKVELDIADKQARNDLKVRFAKKSAEVAGAELKRAIESIEKYRKSVSETELDRLRLASERAVLEVDQAVHERETAALTRDLKQNEYDLALRNVERRQIRAPIDGVVVQVKRRGGEWVQPGDAVVRLLRIDRLRVEGFINVRELRGNLVGAPATLWVEQREIGATGSAKVLQFSGSVVFVSPETNPVNGQVRIWAEVENRGLQLRPGTQGTLRITLPAPQATARSSGEGR